MNVIRTILILAACAAPSLGLAQEQGYGNSAEGSVAVAPLYQQWSVNDTLELTQFSSVVDIRYPLSRSLSVFLRSAPLTAESNFTKQVYGTQSLSGLNDTQIGASYFLDAANLAFTLGIGLPTGQRELSIDEFLTGLLLSNRVFAFQSPHLGQGLKVHPGVLWAVSLSENVAAGIGAAYQYRGVYNPIQNFGSYDPGDEILGIVGIDIKTGSASVVSVDASYTRFATDKLDGEDIFEYGDRIAVNAQYRTAFGHDGLWLFGRYRFKTDSRLIGGSYLVPSDTRLEPNNMEFVAHYGLHLSEAATIGFRLEGRLYETTKMEFSGITLGGGWLMPEFTFGKVSIPIRAGYLMGSGKDGLTLRSYQAGAGIRWRFL